MAAKKLKKVEGHPHLATTEAEFDNPKVGDVRVERAIARDENGQVQHALLLHKASGQNFTSRDLAERGITPNPAEFELLVPTKHVYEVYVFQRRPDTGEFGRFYHRDYDNVDLSSPHFAIMGARWADDGFLVGQVMERGVFKTSSNGQPVVERVRKFDDEAFLPVDQAEDEQEAHRKAAKHL